MAWQDRQLRLILKIRGQEQEMKTHDPFTGRQCWLAQTGVPKCRQMEVWMTISHDICRLVQLAFKCPFIARARTVQVGAQIDDEDAQARGQNMAPGNYY